MYLQVPYGSHTNSDHFPKQQQVTYLCIRDEIFFEGWGGGGRNGFLNT
jgi:hypothetical protein